MFHERQWLQQCGVHAINNLLGNLFYTAADFDRIADEIAQSSSALSVTSYFNPHKSIIPRVGNYDVNVMLHVLGLHSMQVDWFDKRKELNEENVKWKELISETTSDNNDGKMNPVGLLVNVKSGFSVFTLSHWLAVKYNVEDGHWYNMDSKLYDPHQFQNLEELQGFLRQILDNRGEILIVRKSKNQQQSSS